MKTYGKWALFLGGALFGSAGIKILRSRDARKVYTHATAAVLRAKDSVMETVTEVQEECGDILAEAKDINLDRAAREAARDIEELLPGEDEAAAEETPEEI